MPSLKPVFFISLALAHTLALAGVADRSRDYIRLEVVRAFKEALVEDGYCTSISDCTVKQYITTLPAGSAFKIQTFGITKKETLTKLTHRLVDSYYKVDGAFEVEMTNFNGSFMQYRANAFLVRPINSIKLTSQK